MWTFGILFTLSLTTAVLCLDSNEIRSSREIMNEPQQTVMPTVMETVDVNVHNIVRRRKQPECTQEQGNECRGSRKRHRNGNNSTAVPEEKVSKRHDCVKSRDCGEGKCCVHHPGGRRCRPLLKEGNTCLLGGRPKPKSRRLLERCGCVTGLQCRWQLGSLQGQGVCSV